MRRSPLQAIAAEIRAVLFPQAYIPWMQAPPRHQKGTDSRGLQ